MVQVIAGRGGGHDVAHGGAPGHDAHHHDGSGGSALLAIFASTRFWIFASLGFGLSGAMLHWLGHLDPSIVLGVAIGSGFVAGTFAALVFRAAIRSSVSTTPGASSAV